MYHCNLWYVIINCELLSRWFFQAFRNLIEKVMRWKSHGRWKSMESPSRFLTPLVFCNSIIVLWPNAFHLTDIICAIFSNRKEKLLEFFRSYDTTEDSEKNTLELIFPSVHHNSCFWYILLVSSYFPQISSSHLDMLAQGGGWTACTRPQWTLQSERCQYQHLTLLNFQCIHSSTFYLTCCSTNSGAFSTSLHLVSTRTMLWWRPWPKRLRYHLEWSNSMEDLLRISTPVLDLEFPMWVWRFCTRAITTTSSTHTLLLPRVQVSRPPEEIILLIRVGSQQILLDVAEFRW